MSSMMPLLSYSVASPDDDCSPLTSRISRGSAENSPKPSSRIVERKETKRTGKIGEVGCKSESSPRVGRTTGKKKRRPVGKAASRKQIPSDDTTDDKVEELVSKATAHARAGQAVKKAVLKIQLFLLDGVKDKVQLQGASPLLTQSDYSDVVTERSIAKQCGYPLCQKGLVAGTRKGRYRISLQEHKVYDLSETGLFCSANCLVASKTFQSTLQIQRDDIMQKEELKSIMRNVFDPKASQLHHDDKNSKDHQTQSVLSNGPIVSNIQERENLSISSFDDVGPFDAIEGFVPRNSITHLQSSNSAERSLITATDQVKCGSDLQRLATDRERDLSIHPSRKQGSLDKGKSLLIFEELKVETSRVVPLKSALKKGKGEDILKRNVSWEDQRKKDLRSERKDQRSSPRVKERSKAHTHTPQAVSRVTPGDFIHSLETAAATASLGQIVGSGSSVLVTSSVGPMAASERKSNLAVPLKGSETQKSERVLAAEAVAAALVEAAETAAGGEIENEEAMVRAGLSLVPVSETVKELVLVTDSSEASLNAIDSSEASLNDLNKKPVSSTASSTEVDVRWPQLEAEDVDDLDVTAGKEGWHDAPPRNFKVEVSMFGMIWLALEEWISAATIAHIYGKEPQDQEEFVVSNGREFRRQVHVEDSTSAEISRTFSRHLSQAFPDVVRALKLNVPVSTLEQNIGRLVTTMTFVETLPAFGMKQWSMVLMLLLDGLSVHQLPTVGVHLANNMALLRKFLDFTGTSETEYDTFRGLLLPLGRLPSFSTMSGG